MASSYVVERTEKLVTFDRPGSRTNAPTNNVGEIVAFLIEQLLQKQSPPPKLHNYFNQHKAAHHNLSILNEALDKIKSTPTKNNNKQQQKKKKKRGGSNNTPTPGNALASGNRTTDDMTVDTEQPLVNTNDDSTTAGVKRHGEPLEKSDCENELPPDGQLWSQRKNPSYYYQSPWVPPPPMMQLA